MHANCNICVDMTRMRAYEWLGKNHWIPALHAANWLGGDLEIALASLSLGEELELDYGGQTPDAPRIAIRRSVDDVFTVQGPDGWLDVGGDAQWTWPRNDDAGTKELDTGQAHTGQADTGHADTEQSDRLEQIEFAVMAFLRERRGAAGVVLIEPS